MLANGIAVFHAIVLAVYVAGAVSVLRGRFFGARLALWQRGYLVIVLAMSVTTACTERCPLTRLENVVRVAGDPTACYSSSFVEHYVPALPPVVDQIISLVLLAIGCTGALCAFLTWLGSQNPFTEAGTD
jgi:hypothetical protein